MLLERPGGDARAHGPGLEPHPGPGAASARRGRRSRSRLPEEGPPSPLHLAVHKLTLAGGVIRLRDLAARRVAAHPPRRARERGARAPGAGPRAGGRPGRGAAAPAGGRPRRRCARRCDLTVAAEAVGPKGQGTFRFAWGGTRLDLAMRSRDLRHAELAIDDAAGRAGAGAPVRAGLPGARRGGGKGTASLRGDAVGADLSLAADGLRARLQGAGRHRPLARPRLPARGAAGGSGRSSSSAVRPPGSIWCSRGRGAGRSAGGGATSGRAAGVAGGVDRRASAGPGAGAGAGRPRALPRRRADRGVAGAAHHGPGRERPARAGLGREGAGRRICELAARSLGLPARLGRGGRGAGDGVGAGDGGAARAEGAGAAADAAGGGRRGRRPAPVPAEPRARRCPCRPSARLQVGRAAGGRPALRAGGAGGAERPHGRVLPGRQHGAAPTACRCRRGAGRTGAEPDERCRPAPA